MHPSRISLVILMALVGGAISGLLMFDHHGVGTATEVVSEICGPDSDSGCNAVSASRYSTIAGFSLGGLGLVYYASLAFLGALALVTSESKRNAASALGFGIVVAALAMDVGLFGIQAFIVEEFCTLCIATYGVNLVIAILLFPWASKLASIKTTLFGGEGVRMFVVWALGSLVILVSAVYVDRALASTPVPQTDMLGRAVLPAPHTTPAPPPTSEPEPAPEPEPSLPEPQPEPEPVPPPVAVDTAKVDALETELSQVRARITELEATLDDPQKYQEYQLAKAQSAFEQEAVNDVSLDGVPFKGPADAKVRVVEFSDFLCPYCRNLAGAFANYMPNSGGRVAIYFKNYPLDKACNPDLSRTVHEGACEVALGAVCADEQGKFWPYHDQVFAQPPQNPTHDDVVRIATAAGLDGGRLGACMATPAAQEKLVAQIDEARRLEVRSTPTVFINGKRLGQLAGFLNAIQSELGN